MPRTASSDIEGQETMFPELEMDDPQHKALFAAAKRFAKAKRERDEVLSTAKEKVDSCGEKLIALMHEVGITKFSHNGIRTEIIARGGEACGRALTRASRQQRSKGICRRAVPRLDAPAFRNFEAAKISCGGDLAAAAQLFIEV